MASGEDQKNFCLAAGPFVHIPRLEGDGFEPLVLRDNDPFSAVAPDKLLGRDREFADSLLERGGFELPVPRAPVIA
jgi:hypothetical protein